ncbi:MAG: BMC domain-containing protein [Synergistaceae bacterium]|nr:BMC domain-containing protein [Synergistaceae bacterium]
MRRRMPPASHEKIKNLRVDAIGLIQANIANILYFADVAQKAAAVCPVELNGSCPQHITTLALIGDVSAVETAMRSIEEAAASPSGANGF